jgi:hypothetical protein
MSIAALLVIVLAATLAAGCGDAGTGSASPEETGTALTGFWVYAGETAVAPETMIRVTSTAGGYLVEPSSLGGVHWSKASKDGDALVMEATGPSGQAFVVRLEPAGNGSRATLTISPAQGDGQPLFTADLARPPGDYADLAAKFEDTLAQARESAVKEGIHSLQVGVQSWTVDHGDKAPPPRVVRPDGGVETYLDVWPTNPYSGGPMEPGEAPGQYTYERVDGGLGFRLSGHLEGGGDFTVP